MNVDFDDGTHAYSIGGRRIPSVTQILKDQGLTNYRDSEAGILARDFGKQMHKIMEEHLHGYLSVTDLEGLEPEYRIPALGLQRYLDRENYGDILFIEKPIAHSKWLYGGTPDLFVEKKRGFYKYALYDWKFGGMDEAYKIQICAYEELVKNHIGLQAESSEVDRWIVFVSRTGEVKPIRVIENYRNLTTFFSAMNVWTWRREHGKLEEP